MKISRIETIPVQVPINPERAIRGGRGGHTVSPFLLIRIHTDEGIVGLGEVSCTPIWSGEDQFTSAHFIEHILAPLLTGQDPTQIERLTAAVNTAVANNPFTKAGIEMALWDILGKVAGLPLYRLLGGPVRDRVRTKFSVSGLAPDRAAGIAAWAVEQGFDTMKVKVGLDPVEDVARVAAVRQAVGPDVRLGVDANGGWSVRTAIQTIQQLYQYDIGLSLSWLESRDSRAAKLVSQIIAEEVSMHAIDGFVEQGGVDLEGQPSMVTASEVIALRTSFATLAFGGAC